MTELHSSDGAWAWSEECSVLEERTVVGRLAQGLWICTYWRGNTIEYMPFDVKVGSCEMNVVSTALALAV